VKVWDIHTGDVLSPPIPISATCLKIRFTHDGNGLIVETNDQSARVWDAQTGLPLSPVFHATSLNDQSLDATLEGDTLLVRRNADTTCFDRWQLLPDPRPVGELKTLAETIAGQRREVNGILTPISAEELRARRLELFVKHPENFGSAIVKPEDVMIARPDPRGPQLVKMLGDLGQLTNRRMQAARMLGEIQAVGTQPDLVRALRNDPAVDVRVAAAATLGDLGKLEPATIEALLVTIGDQNDAYLRSTAVRALRTAAKETFKDLIRLLSEDKTVNVRAAAAYALRYGPVSNDTVLAALRGASAEGQPWLVRVESAYSFAILKPMDVESVKVLAQAAAQQADSWPQSVATSYLDELGPRSSVAVPVLVRLVEKGRYQPHYTEKTWHALHALARIGPGAKEALPVLLARLDQDAANAHWFDNKTNYVPAGDNMMAFTTARIGPSAIPELLKIVRDAEAPQRRAAILAQGPLGPTRMFGTVLLTRIEEVVQTRRRAAVIALGFLGPAAKDTLPELEALRMQQGEQDKFMDVALDKAIGRISDPKAVPLDQFEY
jgi:HEAT repeat protein